MRRPLDSRGIFLVLVRDQRRLHPLLGALSPNFASKIAPKFLTLHCPHPSPSPVISPYRDHLTCFPSSILMPHRSFPHSKRWDLSKVQTQMATVPLPANNKKACTRRHLFVCPWVTSTLRSWLPLTPMPATWAIFPFWTRLRPFPLSAWQHPPQSTQMPCLHQRSSLMPPLDIRTHCTLSHPTPSPFCNYKEPWFVDFEVNVCLPGMTVSSMRAWDSSVCAHFFNSRTWEMFSTCLLKEEWTDASVSPAGPVCRLTSLSRSEGVR